MEKIENNILKPDKDKENMVLDFFREKVRGLQIFHLNEAPVKIPENYQEVSIDDLKNNSKMFDSLVRCYQEVFGSSDIWGEGKICVKCGKIMPLDHAFEKCDCGGNLENFYPDESLKKRIIHELTEVIPNSSFCVVMKSLEDDNKINGFCWGAIGNVQNITKRIVDNRYNGDSLQFKNLHQLLVDRLSLKSLDERVLFIDELGVVKADRRQGMAPVIYLTRIGFEHGNDNNVQKTLMWTHKKSPIYKICLASGYQEIFATEDGIVYLYLKDLRPTLTLLQNKTFREYAVIMGNALNLGKQ